MSSVAVVASKYLIDGEVIAEQVKVTLPEIKWKTATISGAGLGGDIEVPLTGLTETMSSQVDLRSVTHADAVRAMAPGFRSHEVRFLRDTIGSDGTLFRAGTKIYLQAAAKSLTPGTVQIGQQMDSNAAYTVVRYRMVEDGKETFLIDQLNQIFKLGGKNYSDSYQL